VRVLKYLLIICIIVIINHPISVSAAEVSDELSTAEYESNEIGENVNLGIHTNFCMIIENDKPSSSSNPDNTSDDTTEVTSNQVVNVSVNNPPQNNIEPSGDIYTDNQYVSVPNLPPRTGDDFNLVIYIFLMLTSGTLVLLIIKRLLSNKSK
jgi:hypothetical protein